MSRYALGLDLGGTNAKALAITQTGRVLAHASAPCGPAQRAWKRAVREAVAEVRERVQGAPSWTGVAAPGLPSADRRSIAIMPGRLRGLEGLVWRSFLGAATEVPVLNDAQAALVGETWLGAARGSSNAILLTLGTGVGGAAMVDGRILRGHIGRAGHLGHVSLDPVGAPDVTGTPGSLEDAIGDWTVPARTGGRFASTQALVAAATRGDSEARRVWLASVRALAAAIASFINVLDPQVVVIGGGIARSGSDLFRPLRRDLARFEWRPGGSRVRIVPAMLGERAGACGAAFHGMALATSEGHP